MSWLFNHLPWWIWALVACVPIVIFWPYFMALPRPAKAALLALGGGIAAYFAGRNRGAKDVEDKQKIKDAKATRTRLETDREVDLLTPADRDRKFTKWLRSNDK